jgi:hypothetical protein
MATTAEGSTGPFAAVTLATGAALVVTVTEDELDGGAGVSTVAAAGGSADLSLREALHIAENLVGDDRITFSPVVFPPTGETTILIGDEPLPVLDDHRTVIDGSGAGEVIDGGAALRPAGRGLLHVDASGVEVRATVLRNWLSPSGACVYIDDGDRIRVVDSFLTHCGTGESGAAVAAWSSIDELEVSRNVIANAEHAVILYEVLGAVVFGNDISITGGSAILLDYAVDQSFVSDNRITTCGMSGIKLGSGCNENQLTGNLVTGCAAGGITLDGSATQNGLAFNTLVGNAVGVGLYGSATATLANNLIAGNASFGIDDSTTGTWTEQHTLFFDNGGDGTSGANAIDPARALAGTDVLADPLFADAAAGDYTPQAGAVDAGLDLGLDRNGAQSGLFNGAAPDIGAVESP